MPDDTDGNGRHALRTEVDRLRARLHASEARGEAERAEAEAERARLTFELGHRVKNTLSVVQALASQTLRASMPRDEALEAFGGRIMALSRANDLILGQGWTTTTLRSVADAVLAADVEAARLAVAGPDVAFPASAALSFAMALHELETNAARYGALTRPDGRVDLTWRVDGPDGGPLLVLTWRETGGPPATAPEKRGFGLKLIEQSLRSAFGRDVTVAFPPEGLLCTVRTPVPQARA